MAVVTAERAADDHLDYAAFAALAGVAASTLRGYRTEGRLPEPDSSDAAGRPRWARSTVQAWIDARPGRGNYTRKPVQVKLEVARRMAVIGTRPSSRRKAS